MSGYIYIMANQTNSTLYIGVTSNLIKRVYEHKNELCEGFTKKYKTTKLVYFEVYDDIVEAIKREKQLKKWNRKWKDELIGKSNMDLNDLYEEIIG